ncbi:MAG: response regulator transcription factor [Saprospiraceae bacterium]|nr:response regulator transcription factor [Saprospiraceae bacterium]
MKPWLTILIADDEPPARRKLQTLLEEEPSVATIHFAQDGDETIQAIHEVQPDLVLLDVQMPGKSGFEVIAAVGVEHMPAVIFVTAYDQYALKAFEVHAVDYLLKPYDKERFHQAFHRAIDHIGRLENYPELLRKLLDARGGGLHYPERFMVQLGSRIVPVAVEDILYLEADDKYVELHTTGQKYLLRESLANMQSKLDPSKFARIHRSHIIQINAIRQLTPRSHGDYWIEMVNGERLILSRRYRDQLI